MIISNKRAFGYKIIARHATATEKRANLVFLAPLVAAAVVVLMLVLIAFALAITELLAVTVETAPGVVVDETVLKERTEVYETRLVL